VDVYRKSIAPAAPPLIKAYMAWKGYCLPYPVLLYWVGGWVGKLCH